MFLAAIWRERGWRARALLPVAALYGWVSALRREAYRSGRKTVHRIRVPVVVVGNVIAGGAGKTPAVIAIAQHLGRRGLHVGVISRGHGRETTDARLVDASSTAREVGDEPLLVWRRTGVPVAVASRRVDAATALLDAWPKTDVILSDDGLQHLGLARDVEVCVFDDRGIGNGWLLPAGPLREPWPRQVDLVLHTGARAAFSGFRSRRVLADDAVDSNGTLVPLAMLTKEPCIAVAGIANPDAFFDMLRARGIVAQACHALPDHFDFVGWRNPAGPGQRLLCTEKDAVKLWVHEPEALAVPLAFEPELAFLEAFDACLDARLSSRDGHQTA